MSAFFRYPHTPHLAWLGAGRPRADKVLAPAEVRDFLSHAVVVEEKVDGANLGFSVDGEGALQAQNRGSYLDLAHLQGQWKPLQHWLRSRERELVDLLFPDLILFGEWCYAVHSIRYTRLPDWFLVFDVYDRASDAFWSSARRNELAARLGMAVVPTLADGRFSMSALRSLLGASQLTDGPAEGLYLRRESKERVLARAKLVRGEFTQAIGEHWSKRAIQTNSLAKTPAERMPWA